MTTELPIVDIPKCRWRGAAKGGGWYECSSPKLIVGRRGVHGDHCRQCYLADHEPPTNAVVDRRSEVKVQVQAEDTGTPNAGQMVMSFTSAMAEWAAAGFPRRTPEQIARIEAICRAKNPDGSSKCGFFQDGAQPKCGKCGCRMEPTPLLLGLESPGKWEMATTKCPIELWGPDYPPSQESKV